MVVRPTAGGILFPRIAGGGLAPCIVCEVELCSRVALGQEGWCTIVSPSLPRIRVLGIGHETLVGRK